MQRRFIPVIDTARNHVKCDHFSLKQFIGVNIMIFDLVA